MAVVRVQNRIIKPDKVRRTVKVAGPYLFIFRYDSSFALLSDLSSGSEVTPSPESCLFAGFGGGGDYMRKNSICSSRTSTNILLVLNKP